MTDSALVAAAQHGDKSAMDELARRHLAAAVSVARRAGCDSIAADEIGQEAVLRSFRRLDTLSSALSYRPWLCSIAHNIARDSFRANSSRQSAELRYNDHVVQSVRRDVYSAIDHLIDVERAVRLLPEAERAALVLQHVHGLSVAETARQLGVSESTVKNRTRRAHEFLRDECTPSIVFLPLLLSGAAAAAAFPPRPLRADVDSALIPPVAVIWSTEPVGDSVIVGFAGRIAPSLCSSGNPAITICFEGTVIHRAQSGARVVPVVPSPPAADSPTSSPWQLAPAKGRFIQAPPDFGSSPFLGDDDFGACFDNSYFDSVSPGTLCIDVHSCSFSLFVSSPDGSVGHVS